MSASTTQKLPLGTTAPYANMHKWLQRGLIVCLTGLVIEGAFVVPACLVWFGWPTLSMQEMCDELAKVRFSDDSRVCVYPYPLFGPAEAAGQKTAQDVWGVQPRPLYKKIGFRDLVKWRDDRLAREAAARQAAQLSSPSPPPNVATP